ncbi:MCE family protein [Mycobacterium sp. NPDC003449]
MFVAAGCSWQGANSLPLPGTRGHGPGAYSVQIQLPDVDAIERNSRVRVGDVTVGSVTAIERQGWHALVTVAIERDVKLPANASATIGQTSLLGSKHIELAPPSNAEPNGSLTNGSVIPLSSGATYPSTEQTLSAVSLVLNGGGIGNIQEITRELSTAFAGREGDLRDLIDQLDVFMASLADQVDDITAATDSLNALAARFAENKLIVDRAVKSIPEALAVLKSTRDDLANALDRFGEFSSVTADTVTQTKDRAVQELHQLGPVLQSLGDAGPALTRSLSFLTAFPFAKETLPNVQRGDYMNLTSVFDLTMSRLDQSFFVGTRFEGNLTELELQWGRTLGQLPSPYNAGNPLALPYRTDQGR